MVRISQNYGITDFAKSSGYYKNNFHSGIDYIEDSGNVLSYVDGKVLSTKEEGGYGGVVTVLGNDGRTYKYSHLREFGVQPGQTVSKGMMLGLMGGGKGDTMAGTSTGRHIDVRVLENGKYINPSTVINFGETITPISNQSTNIQQQTKKKTFFEFIESLPSTRFGNINKQRIIQLAKKRGVV